MTRYFTVNVSCASCKSHIDKQFKDYPEIKYSVNLMEKMLKVDADEEKYPDELIIKLAKQAGYDAEPY
ncbi:copper chaperone CopZ [Mycoplasmopsis mustelae]|uniref:Copper chaperone CopZ n=1 Tax=Mycoplasmopsis mustelae TaxID=171289 RepID=A0A4V3FP05_9BACT|nr:heavy-metal-associated domain-containing protein [Mycoplasmopsis mustelae]TDV24480.1 copper chaperone CopZ [Mycoplasmopsis mustelae]